MKTTLDYLNEQKEMAYHNLHCYSMNYAMTIPNGEYETEFYEAKRNIEIIDELIDQFRTPRPILERTIGDYKSFFENSVLKYGATKEELLKAHNAKKSLEKCFACTDKAKEWENFHKKVGLLEKVSQQVFGDFLSYNFVKNAMEDGSFKLVLDANLPLIISLIIGRVERDFNEIVD